MRSGIKSQHWSDAAGKPAGGITQGTGFVISWQNGPLGRCSCDPAAAKNAELANAVRNGEFHFRECERKAPNGAFVEDVLAGLIDRLEYYQSGEFACEENREALNSLYSAQSSLNLRTQTRTAQRVEGTHQRHESTMQPAGV